ncbi:Eco57I restriction-modification methylase domain-containing protein [Anabaena sp. CS-542/02]|uniref:Eco57I restriction-modification methylase domain-containing protein n=1 Tax=Anabaena sp. CS-542/02 TaxID=3021719 RepID=UPI00232B5DF5|nr:DNA methyltransferase [Anabaena sp. CS-542/02]MDB9444833.1 N-6 DNA methylase [Anabaena sp. CS-542/02]
MMKDREIQQHKEWLGFLQPVGLVVSPIALNNLQVSVNRNVVELQQRLNSIVTPLIADFPNFTQEILGWEPTDLVPAPDDLVVSLPEYGEILKPTYGVPDPDHRGWLMLVKVISPGIDLDRVREDTTSTGWRASPQAKFERLLREQDIPVGILCNGSHLRLVYAPRGESSGHLTFPVQAMGEVSGRLILGAMHMLLEEQRVFNGPTERRLLALLENSRKYQNEVSTKLSAQVLDALWDLLRGFQSANVAAKGRLFDDIAKNNSQYIYGGLITVLLRLVFLLYAEDEGLMPQDRIYISNYSVTGLYERLRTDAGNYPDTMDQRYGAWAWLLSLFRLVHDGGSHGDLYLPPRAGQLFDPDEYPFLEGRSLLNSHLLNSNLPSQIEPPRVSDGVVYRILDKLLVLDGDRLSYRALDVEQIGSVYEGVMGYEVEQATSPSIGVWSKPNGAKHSVTVVVSVEEILQTSPKDRSKYLQEVAGCEVSGKSLTELTQAQTAKDVITSLGQKISPQTPSLLPPGSLYLQPGEERRNSGSHYTPRSLTESIVKETLRPVLESMGANPTPEQILNLKVCDPAMGSGAFLVEACRQLAEKLVEAWDKNPGSTTVSSNEEPLVCARRLIAERCLYGVDKNPFAVTLGKISIWLVTFADNYPLTFLDHCFKSGDSLVGLTQDQIKRFTWENDRTYDDPDLSLLNQQLSKSRFNRDEIYRLRDEDYQSKQQCYQASEELLTDSRVKADMAIAAFFAANKPKARKEKTDELFQKYFRWRQNPENNTEVMEISQGLRSQEKPVIPFNWELEFPEVFNRPNPGFDVIVGNPPFAGKNTTINANAPGYLDWLKVVHPDSHGNADLAAHFFRRAFTLLRKNGTFGLIATNTISQGDTRYTGLRYICENGGTIYNATKRLKWPGVAAVVVSIVHVIKGEYGRVNQDVNMRSVQPVRGIDSRSVQPDRGINSLSESENPLKRINGGVDTISNRFQPISAIRPETDFRAGDGVILDGKPVNHISAFLFKAPGNNNPKTLLANAGKSFQGSIVLGMGFTFDDTNPNATPITEMHRLIESNPKNQECIFPYIGGEEVNSSPTHAYHRYVINFGDMSEQEARGYPDLMAIVETKVKPDREKQNDLIGKQNWWQFLRTRGELYNAIAPLDRVLVISRIGQHSSFTFLPSNYVYSESLVIFPYETYSTFTVLQSHIHEIWARFFGSSMKNDLRYTPSDCFETFPFPENWEHDPNLESVGREYYEYRAALMVRNNEGLTKTYNRFHDPNNFDPEIIKLRELHMAMDKAVIAAYGWFDLKPQYEFILDYEEEEDSNKRKKPWRYRYPDDLRDEILARLIRLNGDQYELEILGGKGVDKPKPQGKTKKTAKKKPNPLQKH